VPSTASGKKTRFSGFIPNFGTRDYYQEVENAGASNHKNGYRAGILKGVTVHDGMGNKERAWMTSRESKKTFTNASGFKATQITPPNGFSSDTMMASSGFVPNFGAFRGPVTKEEIEIAKKQMAESGRAGYLKRVGAELTDQQIAKELRNSTLPMDPVGRGKALNDKIQSLTEGAATRFNKQVAIINQRRQSIGLAPLTESRIAQLESAGAKQPTQNEWNELFKNQYRKISSAEYDAAIAKDAKLRGESGFRKGGYIARPDTPENQVINLGDLSSKPGGISLVHSMERGPQAITAQTPIDTKKGGSGKAYRASVLTSGIDTSVIKGALPNTKQRMEEAVTQLANDFGRSLGLKNTLTVADIPNAGSVASAAGVAFEQALTGFVKRSTRRAENARVDFADPTNLRKFFYNIPGMYEAKQNPGPKNVQDVIKKYVDTNKEFQSEAARVKKPNIAPFRAGKWTPSPEEQKKLEALKSQPKTNNPYLQAYSGFIPNFGPNIAAIQKLMTQGATSGERQAAFAAMQRIQSNALSKLGTGDKLTKFRELLYGSKSNAGFNLDAIKIKDLKYKPLLAGAKELGLSMKDLELLAGNPIAINQLRGLSGKTKSSSFAKGFLPSGSGQKLNPLLGRNKFQANWIKEFAKKNNIDLKNPDAMFKIASAFAKKYPNEQSMFGFNSGFIPNFASEFKTAQKRAVGAEKLFGKGAVMDEYKGMSYVRQPGQSSNFKTMMKQDHPEGFKAAVQNSAVSQGLSRGFIPNFAPNEEEYGGGLTASALQGLLMTLAFTLPQRGSMAEGIEQERRKNAEAFIKKRSEDQKFEAQRRANQQRSDAVRQKQSILSERRSGKITQEEARKKYNNINKVIASSGEDLKKSFIKIDENLQKSNERLSTNQKYLSRINEVALKNAGATGRGASLFGKAASIIPGVSQEKAVAGFEGLKQKGRGIRESQIFKGPGAGLGGAIAAPILAETIAAELGRDTTGGRVASAAGNAASFALTGAAIGGPKGALVGGLVGGGMLLNEIITARGSTLSETSKESEKATQEAGRINDLAGQALSDIGDYYEAVGSQGPDSKKAKKLKKQLTSTISKFGPDSAKKLFEAFYQGPEKFQEEIGKQQDQATKEQKTREAGQALSKISEGTRARKSFAGIFTSQLPDLLFGQETKGGLKGYTSDLEKENISDTVRQGLFGGLGSQEILDRVEKDFGGAGNLIKIFTDAEAATKKFEKRVKELGGTGGRSLEKFAESMEYVYGSSEGKEFLSTIDKQKKALLDLTEKGFGASLSESGRKAFLENLDVTALRQVGGDVAKDIVDARGIIKQEEDVRTTRGESNQMRVAQQMAKVQSEMQDYTGRGGESFGEIISSYQTGELNKLERQRLAGPTPDIISYNEEREAKRQERIQKSQRRLDFLQQYGVKGGKSDMQSIIQEAYGARIAEAEDLGIANMPGLKQSIFENIRRQVYGFAGRGDETAQYEVDMKADAKRRQQAMPEYIQKKSQFEQQISGYGAEQLVKEQEKVKSNLGIQQELLGLMRSEAGMTGEGAAQKMIQGIDREIQDMGPVFSYEKDRQDQLQSLIEKRSQVENYLPQLRQTSDDYNVIRGQEAGSEMMIQSMQQMLQSLRQGTKEQPSVPAEDKDASGKATNQAAANMATSADKIASASEKAASAMSAFATSAASSIEKLTALSAMPTPASNAPNTSAMGFIPNFAMPSKKNINQTKNLESFASGKTATYHTNPFPHVRNAGQPTFGSAMRDHGGLENALNDSAEMQKNFASGFIPNFASFGEIKAKFSSKPEYSTAFGKIDKIKDFFTNFRAPELPIPNFAYNPEMVPGNTPRAMKKAFANVQEVIAIVSQNLGFNAGNVNTPTSMSTGKYGQKGRAFAAVTTSSMGDSNVWFSDRLGRGNTLGIIANEATHVNQGLNILYDRNSYTNKLKSFTDFLESKGMVTGAQSGGGFSDNRRIAFTTTQEDSMASIQNKKKEIQEKADFSFKKDILKSESEMSQFAKITTSSLSQKIREQSEKTSSTVKNQHDKTLRDIENSFNKNQSLANQEIANFDQTVSRRRGGIGSEFNHSGDQQAYETERLSSLMHGLVSGIQVGNINAQDLVSSGAAANYDQAVQIIESVSGAEQMLRNSGINAARGFIPNFSNRNLAGVLEKFQAKNANYRSGILKTVTAHDGLGNSFKTYANSREAITRGTNDLGYKATMIEPPNGFNFAAKGYIPNFAPRGGVRVKNNFQRQMKEASNTRQKLLGLDETTQKAMAEAAEQRRSEAAYRELERRKNSSIDDAVKSDLTSEWQRLIDWGNDPDYTSRPDTLRSYLEQDKAARARYDRMQAAMSGKEKINENFELDTRNRISQRLQENKIDLSQPENLSPDQKSRAFKIAEEEWAKNIGSPTLGPDKKIVGNYPSGFESPIDKQQIPWSSEIGRPIIDQDRDVARAAAASRREPRYKDPVTGEVKDIPGGLPSLDGESQYGQFIESVKPLGYSLPTDSGPSPAYEVKYGGWQRNTEADITRNYMEQYGFGKGGMEGYAAKVNEKIKVLEGPSPAQAQALNLAQTAVNGAMGGWGAFGGGLAETPEGLEIIKRSREWAFKNAGDPSAQIPLSDLLPDNLRESIRGNTRKNTPNTSSESRLSKPISNEKTYPNTSPVSRKETPIGKSAANAPSTFSNFGGNNNLPLTQYTQASAALTEASRAINEMSNFPSFGSQPMLGSSAPLTNLSDSSINGIQQGMENAIKNSAPAMSNSSFGMTPPPSYQPVPYTTSPGGSAIAPNPSTMGADPTQLARQSALSYANTDKPVYDFNYTASQTPAPVSNAPYVQPPSPQAPPAPQAPQAPQQQGGGTSFQSLEQAIKSAEQTIKASEQTVKSAEQAVRELANKNNNKDDGGNGGQNADVTLEVNVDVDPPEVSIDLNVDTKDLSSQLASLPSEVMGAIQPTINQIQTELTRVKQEIAILFQSLSNNR
jgi:hypothetical protein